MWNGIHHPVFALEGRVWSYWHTGNFYLRKNPKVFARFWSAKLSGWAVCKKIARAALSHSRRGPQKIKVSFEGRNYCIGVDVVYRHREESYGAKVKYFDYAAEVILNVPRNADSIPLLLNEVRQNRRFSRLAPPGLAAPLILEVDENSGVFLERLIPEIRHFGGEFFHPVFPARTRLISSLAFWYEKQEQTATTAADLFSDYEARLRSMSGDLGSLAEYYRELGNRYKTKTAVSLAQIHGDFSLGNFSVSPGSGDAIILDWEFSRVGFIGYDLVTLALPFDLNAVKFFRGVAGLIAEYNQQAARPIELSAESAILFWSMDRVLFQLEHRSHNHNETRLLFAKHCKVLEFCLAGIQPEVGAS